MRRHVQISSEVIQTNDRLDLVDWDIVHHVQEVEVKHVAALVVHEDWNSEVGEPEWGPIKPLEHIFAGGRTGGFAGGAGATARFLFQTWNDYRDPS